MTTLVLGATGATGRLLVEQLLDRGEPVKAIVRTPEKLPQTVINHDQLTVIQASVLELSDDEMSQYVGGCHAVASCLGHNLTLKGLYGKPRLLVSGDYRVDNTGHPNYDVSPDGQAFVMIQGSPREPLTEIHLVINWFEELERLVPTK